MRSQNLQIIGGEGKKNTILNTHLSAFTHNLETDFMSFEKYLESS